MNFCNLPDIVLMKVLRYLDLPSIIDTMNTNRFLYQTVNENHHRLAKLPIVISIYEYSNRTYRVSISPEIGCESTGIVRSYDFVLSKSIEGKRPLDTNSRKSQPEKRTFFFTSAGDLYGSIGEMVDNVLKRTTPKVLKMTNTGEDLLKIISTFLLSNHSPVEKLSFSQRLPLSPASLCQFVRSLRGVEEFEFILNPLSLNEEILKIPQVRSAKRTVDIKPRLGVFPRLSLTDSDILALSATNIRFQFGCDYSPNFIRAFVKKFLSMETSGPLRNYPFFDNHLELDTTNLTLEKVFEGMSCELDSENRDGYIMRDDGVVFAFVFSDTSFRYCLCVPDMQAAIDSEKEESQ